MADQSQKRKPYKKKLGIFELKALADEHRGSPVFLIDRDGECVLEPWLKALRYQQALQVAGLILEEEIDEQGFRNCWARTQDLIDQPEPKQPSKPPNTATFGGYRLKRRAALHQHRGAPKKRRW